MKIKFDPDQPHQIAAIAAVVDLFDSQPKLAPESKPVKGADSLAETVICRDDAMSDETALNLSFRYNLKVL